MLSNDECDKILETYRSMADAPDEDRSRELTLRLTTEELGLAAMRSHAYFVTSLKRPEILTDEVRFFAAMREAARHLEGIDELDDAHRLLKATLQYHKDQKTHIYRTCMQEDFAYDNQEDSKLASERRARIIRENRDVQAMVIRGHDRQKNAVWVSMPRKQQGNDPQAFVDTLIYTIERCCATTEALTSGRQCRMVAVLDCNKSAAPTIKALKLGIAALQEFYPGRLKNLIGLDLNYILQTAYSCVKPFLDAETKQKFIIVKGTKSKDAMVSMHIDAEQAQTNVISSGKLSSYVDAEWFVKEVPFHKLYDDGPPKEGRKHISSPVGYVKSSTKIPTACKSPRTFKSKPRTLAVGSMTRCLSSVTVQTALN